MNISESKHRLKFDTLLTLLFSTFIKNKVAFKRSTLGKDLVVCAFKRRNYNQILHRNKQGWVCLRLGSRFRF